VIVVKFEETIKYFVQEAKKDFFIVEKNLESIIKEVKENNFDHIEFFDEGFVLKQLKELKDDFNKGKKEGKLFGVPITVKDTACVKDLESKSGSTILEGYIPLFDASVIKKAKDEGAIIVAKTTQDEFGFGTFSTNTKKIPKNPWDEARSCGGSSGGCAGFTAFTKNYHISIGESTGGSIACPSSYCGVISATPTYGLVSRNGLIDYANSLDKFGCLGRSVDDVFDLLEVISGEDLNDSTNLGNKYKKEEVPLRKVAIVKDILEKCDENVRKIFLEKVEELKKFVKVEEVTLPLNLEYALSAYYIIATSETSTNLAKLCGLRYGVQGNVEGKHFDDYFSEIRSQNFSEEAKRRIILGTFARMSGYRDAYYLKSMKVRTKLINEFKEKFKDYDALLFPTMPTIAPKFDEIKNMTPMQNYAMDLCTVPANLAGLPHISINAGFSQGMPVGLMAVANHLEENKLYSLGKVLE
jgi:aspartyl-tRNA(Asn)/glutamyl-tRNA(Gln) amidotransferase subunit A